MHSTPYKEVDIAHTHFTICYWFYWLLFVIYLSIYVHAMENIKNSPYLMHVQDPFFKKKSQGFDLSPLKHIETAQGGHEKNTYAC